MSNAPTITQVDRWNGFRFTKVKTMQGRDGEAYSADITLTDADGNTRTVGTSRNDGNGGSDFRHFTDRDAEAAFTAHASALYPNHGHEVDDRLAADLVTVATFNRKRATLFITKDMGDFWDWDNPKHGTYATLSGTARNDDVDFLRGGVPDATHVWVKDKGDFVAIGAL